MKRCGARGATQKMLDTWSLTCYRRPGPTCPRGSLSPHIGFPYICELYASSCTPPLTRQSENRFIVVVVCIIAVDVVLVVFVELIVLVAVVVCVAFVLCVQAVLVIVIAVVAAKVGVVFFVSQLEKKVITL